MPSSETLFIHLSYVMFIAPCAVVVIWVVWRSIVWCTPLWLRPYLADRLEGPKIAFWHWLLVFGPIPVLAIWLVVRVRRKPEY